jgi:uncharacterized protein (TIGR02117 family)
VLLVLLVTAACLGPVAGLYPPRLGEPTKRVWVTGHRLHTGIVVRRADVPSAIWPERDDFPGSTSLEVGWGDRDYYQAPRGTPALALRAIVASRGSVLHVVAFDARVEDFYPEADVVELTLTERGFEALCRFIHASYARDDRGAPIVLGPGAYARSAFYLATGTYRLFNNCNTWTARALRAAGCPITPAWALTPRAVIGQAGRFGRVVRFVSTASSRFDPPQGDPAGVGSPRDLDTARAAP